MNSCVLAEKITNAIWESPYCLVDRSKNIKKEILEIIILEIIVREKEANGSISSTT